MYISDIIAEYTMKKYAAIKTQEMHVVKERGLAGLIISLYKLTSQHSGFFVEGCTHVKRNIFSSFLQECFKCVFLSY